MVFTAYQPQMMLLTLQRHNDKEIITIPESFKVINESLGNSQHLSFDNQHFLLTQESDYAIYFEEKYIVSIGTVSVWRAIKRDDAKQDPIYLYADEH